MLSGWSCRTWRFLVLIALAGLAACATTALAPSSFAPQYIAQGPTFDAVPACAQYRSLSIGDSRPNKTVVGVRFYAEHPATRYDISLRGDLVAPLARALYEAFRRAVLNRTDSSTVQIDVSVASIDLEEKTSFNSSYNLTLVLDVQVLASANAQVLWSSRKTGHASNYGLPGSEENYREILSRGLEDVLSKLMSDPEFARALCGASAGTPAIPAPAQ